MNNPGMSLLAGGFIFLGGISPLFSSDLPLALSTDDGAEMVLVPEGGFIMGTEQGAPEESPPHRIHLPGFYIDRREVSAAQYARFLAETGHPAPVGWPGNEPPAGWGEYPITNVRWTDALRYALWAGKRLPTEAEWEKAARGPSGRRFPWGDADSEAWRNKDSGKLRPVGSYPKGASTYGCLDMSGNCWEWTADWFLPYPGTEARSVHFGQHYKVIRGGAGEYLYGTANPGTTWQRARLVPYGGHDFVGFRCVKDPPSQEPPYDAEALLKEAEALLDASLRPPRELAHEKAFAQMNVSGDIPLQIVGETNQSGLVVSGFPLPKGRVRGATGIGLINQQGEALPSANAPLSLWPDGSLRWVLLRFPGQGGHTVRVRFSDDPSPSVPTPGALLTLTTNRGTLRISTGLLEVDVNREHLLHSIRFQGQLVCEELEMPLILAEADGGLALRAGPASRIEVESQSALHADLRVQGDFVDGDNQPSPMTYDLRLRATAGSARLRLWLTVLHNRPRQQPWEDMKPQVAVKDWRLELRLPERGERCVLGGEGGPLAITNYSSVELRQPDDLTFTVTAADQAVARGTRAPGWLSTGARGRSVTLGLRHFWQNHPKSLYLRDHALGVGLWAGAEPFLWEGGLAKTHEFVVDFTDAPPTDLAMASLRAVASPDWMCGTEAAGALLPRNDEALRQLAYWECWRENAMRQWLNAMPAGLRDFGDGYMGGPYKGKNAYLNLEYDVPLDFLHQGLRTGRPWYFEAAEAMVRHQGDIDTENVAGFAWKHSPLHTTTQAEFGHVFLRGLLLHHLLTGDPRDREVAEKTGEWIAKALIRGQGVGNERQIGWSLYALTALYEVTDNPLYLQGAQALCHRLVREQASTGKFNIRWDNRIAFFNGIAMNGMLSVNELAPDPAQEQALLRVAHRTLGMYPEYACRTLNAWCWVLRQTGDPRFLDNLERTWISSLEFLLDRDCTTSETHAWRFPSFAVRYNLFPQFKEEPGELPLATSWSSLRFKNREVDLYLKPRSSQPVPLLIVREGLARGTAELVDAQGRVFHRRSFDSRGGFMQSANLALPPDRPWCRLRLSSPDAYAWQIHHDQRLALSVADPKGEQLPCLLPRAIGFLQAGAREITITLEARGEGFHSATLFNPKGIPVGRVQRFIDFEDVGRYELELKAPVSGPSDGWSLELNAVKVVGIAGWLPYWAARADDLFNPEQLDPNGAQ